MTASADTQELLQDFLMEAGELLDDVDRKLVELEQHADDRALLNDIFRGFHTIKGGAGFLDASPLVDVCHRTENLFDRLRSGKQQFSAAMLDVILDATAVVRQMFEQMAARGAPEPADPELLANLSAWIDGASVAHPHPNPFRVEGGRLRASPPREEGTDRAGVELTTTANPSEPNWSALYAAVTGVAQIPGSASSNRNVAPVRSPKAGEPKETTLRIDVGRFDQILNLSGEIGLTKNRLVCLRADLIGGSQSAEILKQLDSAINQLAGLVGELQNSVMKARMQPVERVFQRYVRMARDLGRQLGKDVELQISGEDTEIDKTMLEELYDPLVHLVRNAVDHGVDTPAERVAAGKPPRSVVRLCARQVGDQIVIEIVDDGRGMRPEVIRQKAIEKGAISADEAGALDERGCLNLIFLPGFSTKTEASDVSGRGVGMDVVRTNIQRLNGRIDLSSEPGRGTRIVIALPLTLAILPVLMFRLARQIYSVPLSLVREIIALEPDRLQSVGGRPSMIVRGNVLPVIKLADLVGGDAGGAAVGLVIQHGPQSLVLAVDSFVGQDEVVIKALEGFKPRGVAGATLSPDGSVVLVLDLTELLRD